MSCSDSSLSVRFLPPRNCCFSTVFNLPVFSLFSYVFSYIHFSIMLVLSRSFFSSVSLFFFLVKQRALEFYFLPLHLFLQSFFLSIFSNKPLALVLIIFFQRCRIPTVEKKEINSKQKIDVKKESLILR